MIPEGRGLFEVGDKLQKKGKNATVTNVRICIASRSLVQTVELYANSGSNNRNLLCGV